MEKETITKELTEELMRIEGNVKGEVIRINFLYIREKKGEKGVELVEERLKELGYPIKAERIKTFAWYPEALSVLLILVAKDIFQWQDSDIFDMGNSAPKYSFIVKLLIRYFVSPQKSFRESPRYWRKHFDFGELETIEFNEKEKYLILRVKGYAFHPTICFFHKGFFLKIGQFVINSEKLSIKETKCVYKGDPYHEYLISWGVLDTA